MQLVINGEEHNVDVSTLEDVVSHFELEPHLVVTEVDGEIIERVNWAVTEMKEGMRIELVQFVGGG
ncbi:sulfur carrier protein ThiS [Halalkalibacter wakoensis JCM 9140]|uniref:Sulfur carrier protein ThiS n=1 Tax=Halalkalibacter wakoensis JCM 9140 TaxID=1236970 RepID=W4Q075_9BACI|nr:sulfur carrier protein ThiS [Halalkalibacter wakoensis]GAE24779.1 sulfur carrier protein ThiS [Halalkalibacter wakoensis JCM 9140]